MALARIARANLRRSGGAFGNYASEMDVLCEGRSYTSKFSSKSPYYHVNSKAGGNLSYIPCIKEHNLMDLFSMRGISGTPNYQHPSANTERALEESEPEVEQDEPKYAGLEATKPGEKPRVVVLGTGWAACRFLKGLDTRIYDVVCISPRNHMVFTPLLASTCVGTLEFRSVAEPVSRIQKALSKDPNSYFFLASCTGIDTNKHEVYCEAVNNGISEEEKKRVLHCVVIGGGPTGVEFSGELSDFIMRDVHERYTHVKDYVRVTLIEANEILSSFDVSLRQYAIRHLTKSGVDLMKGVVKEVHPKSIVLSDGSVVPYGLLVWSTGVGPSEFVKALNLPKSPGGRIGVDEWLRVPSVEDVFALGDCAGFLEQTKRPVLPALAQVAEREGKFLVELLNKIGKQNGGKAFSAKSVPLGDPFVYKHIGSMASVGRYKALVDLRESKDAKGISMAGFVSWLIWRSAYLTRVVSWRNRFYVAVNWATTLVFGRDNTRI
ncbi:tubulin alpha 1 [Stylosanthes scabra]|uniref:NADH:ubiquinone reductase (non-electrogenic) n=1 Tax=Stylosanthes scabra TaxID=79078 RepID=A0ABU6WBQ7_9FABA|nr:tubulin alpha 1 [Stylosanthes scabra]